MAGYGCMKMKRKGVDKVSDDFADFSLASPATKIRRLDFAELPAIVEEEEPQIPPLAHQPIHIQEEELPSLSVAVPDNQERAIVLFKPVTSPPITSPSDFSLIVDSNIMSGLKNQSPWSNHSVRVKSSREEAAEECTDNGNDCLAVVPWVPSHLHSASTMEVSSMEAPELIDAQEETNETSMDIDNDNNNENTVQGHQPLFGGVTGGAADGLQQWQQQHCMIPQLPQNTSTPITWFR